MEKSDNWGEFLLSLSLESYLPHIGILRSLPSVAQCVALLPHSKKVVGSSPASCNMSGLVPGPFCVEFACSPRVHPGSPHRTPTIKTCKSRCSSVLIPDQVRTEHLDLVPGRRIAGLGGGCQDGKKAENIFHRRPTCMCVCVCVCHHSLCV